MPSAQNNNNSVVWWYWIFRFIFLWPRDCLRNITNLNIVTTTYNLIVDYPVLATQQFTHPDSAQLCCLVATAVHWWPVAGSIISPGPSVAECPTWCPPHPPRPTPTTQLRLLQKYLGSLTTAATPHTQCLLMLEIYQVWDISKYFLKQVFSMVEVWTATAEQYRCLLGDDGRY